MDSGGRKDVLLFLPVFLGTLIVRVLVLSQLGQSTAGVAYLVGRFVASGVPLYTKVEWIYPPLYAYVLGAVYMTTDGSFFAIELVSVVFSLIALTFAYLIVRLIDGAESGLVVSLVFAVSQFFPWGLWDDYFDILYLALMLVSIYFLLKYERLKSRRHAILSGCFAGLSLLSKQFALLPIAVMFAYMVLRNESRHGVPLFVVSSIFPMLSFLLYPFDSLDRVVPVLHSVVFPAGERLGRFMLSPRPVDLLVFMGVVGCPYFAAKRRNGGGLLLSIYLASIVLLLVIMQLLDTHHCVIITPFVLIGSGVFLNDMADAVVGVCLSGVRGVVKGRGSLRMLKLALVVSIVGAEAILVVHPATLSIVNSRQYDIRFQRECVKFIEEHTSVGDYVLAPAEAVAITKRNTPPELCSDVTEYMIKYWKVHLEPYCEMYRVKLLIIEYPGYWWKSDLEYIPERYDLIAVVVHHGYSDPAYFYVFSRK